MVELNGRWHDVQRDVEKQENHGKRIKLWTGRGDEVFCYSSAQSTNNRKKTKMFKDHFVP